MTFEAGVRGRSRSRRSLHILPGAGAVKQYSPEPEPEPSKRGRLRLFFEEEKNIDLARFDCTYIQSSKTCGIKNSLVVQIPTEATCTNPIPIAFFLPINRIGDVLSRSRSRSHRSWTILLGVGAGAA